MSRCCRRRTREERNADIAALRKQPILPKASAAAPKPSAAGPLTPAQAAKAEADVCSWFVGLRGACVCVCCWCVCLSVC